MACVGRELIGWTQQIQHAERARSCSSRSWRKSSTIAAFRLGKSNSKASAFVGNCRQFSTSSSTMVWVPFKDKPRRAFVCQSDNSQGYPAKDRSGRLEPIEEPHLGKLLSETFNQRRLNHAN